MNNPKRLGVSVLGFIMLAFLMQSCLKEYKNTDKISTEIDHTPSLALSVAKSRLTVRDIIRDYDMDELFQESSSGILFLNYHKKVSSPTADKVIKFPNQNFPKTTLIDHTMYEQLPVIDDYRHLPTISVPNLFKVANREVLHNVVFDSLELVINVSSSFTVGGHLEITFPTLRENNTPAVINIELDSSGSFDYIYNKQFIDCELGFENDSNHVIANLNLVMEDGVSISSDVIEVTISMKNLDFAVAYGYVGHISEPIPLDTVELPPFNSALSGDIFLANPYIALHAENSLGLPVRAYFSDLSTFTANQSDANGSWNTFEFPEEYLEFENPTFVGEVKKSSIIFDKNTFPDLPEIISKYPKYLFFEVDSLVVNPNGYDESLPNFILDTSRVSIDLNVKMPLQGNAWYSLVDTINIDFEDNIDKFSKYFVEANLRMIFENALPTNVYMQVIFLDKNFNPIDSLFEGGYYGNRLINAPILDENTGKVKQAVKTVNDILFGDNETYDHNINDLKKVRKAIIVATLKTNEQGAVGSDAPIVNFSKENYLELSIAVKGTIKSEEILK